MSKWHKGHPPSIGWWPTQALNSDGDSVVTSLRWWNGKHWSVHIKKHEHPDESTLNRWAALKTTFSTGQILWAKRPASWPERSRT